MNIEKDHTSKWKFPEIEGVIVNYETGQWSESAFHNGMLNDDDQVPEVWHQAEPMDWVKDVEAWERWLEYLHTPASKDMIHKLALRNAEHRIRKQ